MIYYYCTIRIYTDLLGKDFTTWVGGGNPYTNYHYDYDENNNPFGEKSHTCPPAPSVICTSLWCKKESYDKNTKLVDKKITGINPVNLVRDLILFSNQNDYQLVDQRKDQLLRPSHFHLPLVTLVTHLNPLTQNNLEILL